MNNFLTIASFLEEYAIILSLSVFGLVLLIAVLFFLVPKFTSKRKETKPLIDESSFFAALGGKENIKSHKISGSRLTIELFDPDKLDLETIKNHGVDRVIKMQSKVVLLINEAVKGLFDIFP